MMVCLILYHSLPLCIIMLCRPFVYRHVAVCVKATPMDNVDCAEMVPLEEVCVQHVCLFFVC